MDNSPRIIPPAIFPRTIPPDNSSFRLGRTFPLPGQFPNILCIHTYTCMHTHTYTYIHTYTHTYTHIHIHTYIHTYIYIHTYTYIYMHVCMYVWGNCPGGIVQGELSYTHPEGFCPCWCSSPFPSLSILPCLPFTLLHLPFHFNLVSSLTPTYLPPFP